MQDNPKARIDALIDLLRLEREVIRGGEFGSIADLAARKEALLSDLAGTPAQQLLRVKELALENQRILSAALKGVRAAQRRLQMIQQASKSFNSYDETGRARAITPGGGSIERRA